MTSNVGPHNIITSIVNDIVTDAIYKHFKETFFHVCTSHHQKLGFLVLLDNICTCSVIAITQITQTPTFFIRLAVKPI